MSNDDIILKPWYEHLYNYDYGQMNSELKWENPAPKAELDPKWSAPNPYAENIEERMHRVITDKHSPDTRIVINDIRTKTLAEMTASARMALRSGTKLSIRHEWIKKIYEPWFEERRKMDLKDVALIGDYVVPDEKNILGDVPIAMICWYSSGKISRVTLSYDFEKEELIIHELFLDDCQFEKPLFPDNYKEFREALLDIADVARNGVSEWWAEYFTTPLHILESDDFEYEKQPGKFYLPKPFFKYYYAVMECNQGGGMGSWNDVPIIGTTDYRRTNHELLYQRCRALLYAINNC